MPMITLPAAKAHLRDEAAPDEQVLPYLNAAEQAAAQFLNRRVYVDQAALDLAVAAVPAALIAAGTAYGAAVAAAAEITDDVARCAALEHASSVYRAAQHDAREIRAGIVINDQIQAAMLLILGHLYENRQENVAGTIVSELKMGVQSLLWPYRVGLGV